MIRQIRYSVNRLVKQIARITICSYNRWFSRATNTYIAPIPILDTATSTETDRHHLVALPKLDERRSCIQRVVYDYVIRDRTTTYTVLLHEAPAIDARLRLKSLSLHQECLISWGTVLLSKEGRARVQLCVNLDTFVAQIEGIPMQRTSGSGPVNLPRRFLVELSIESGQIHSNVFRFSQCLAMAATAADEGYFHGDVYDSYEADSVYLERFLELVQRFKVAGRLLDVGCATGIFLSKLQAVGFDVCGVDNSLYAVYAASECLGSKDKIAICDIDVNEVPFQGKFDCITLIAVLEHVQSPEEVLGKLTDRLDVNGILVIHTANSNSMTHKLLGKDWEGYADYTHRCIDKLTPDFLRAICQNLGLEVIHLQTYGIWRRPYDEETGLFGTLHDHVPAFKDWLERSEMGDFIDLVVRRVN